MRRPILTRTDGQKIRM
ncbi:hypothetical protein E2C01_096374 [Portunus trituberculatus]|uniref:Uncharacterized protein n=1 Tax=Portunus trituberculatus TaxID=210409 RepID=A0A5B7K6P1_PORTR|nr:hypothetical protein [Portunus trituberculatus]